METNTRVRNSIKVSLETKFTKQKAEFLEQFQKQMTAIEQKLAIQMLENNQNLINMNLKIASLEKRNEEKSKIILEQEVLIRCQQAQLATIQPAITISTEISDYQYDKKEDLNLQINELKFKNLRQSVKLSKLLDYFVDLKLYSQGFAAKAQLDDFSCDQLYKPSYPDNQSLMTKWQEMERDYKKDLKNKV